MWRWCVYGVAGSDPGRVRAGVPAWGVRHGECGEAALHFHDLRHSGNTWAARSGTSLADLKARMGHDSARAALIYQHATSTADQRVAAALDERIKAERGTPDDSDDGDDDGTAGASAGVVG